MNRFAFARIVSLVLTLATSSAQADIFQWEYIDPADPSQGKQPSTTLATDGAGVDAVPAAYLVSRNLTVAYLISADLAGANASYANLSNADLSQANLTDANFFGVALTDVNFAGADIRGARFARHPTFVDWGKISLPQLYSTSSYAAHDLSKVWFVGNDFTGGNFADQSLTDAHFDGASLTGADFTNAWVQGASFGAGGRHGTGITLAQLYSTASYKAHDLTGIVFAFNELGGANFARQNLTGASFPSARLTGADFSQANLTNTSFSQTNLTGASFVGQKLASASFYGATLDGADFTAADVRGGFLPATDAITTNLIWHDGHIDGLDLDAGGQLVVRDYDGNPNNPVYYGDPTPPIPITIDQHLTMAPGGTLRMVFEADAWDSTISFAPGIPVTLGGTLELTFAADVNLASQVGRTFELFDWTGVDPTGAFAIASPYAWNLSNLYTTGQVTLTAIPEPTSFVLTAVPAALLVLRRRRRSRYAPSKSKGRLPSQGKEVDPQVAIVGCQAVSGDQQFINGLANRHVSADDKNAGHRETGGDAGEGNRRNRPAIVCQQNSAFEGRPLKHPGVGRTCQVDFASVNEVERRCASSHAVYDVFIEVLIDEKGDHEINPFARARVKISSLVGQAGCDASIVVRMASPCSLHWRRYSSNGAGFARYRLITAYTSAKRSERYDRAMPSGDSPCLKALITNSSRTRLSPTRKTPGESSDNGIFRLSGSKSTVLTVPILPSCLATQPPGYFRFDGLHGDSQVQRKAVCRSMNFTTRRSVATPANWPLPRLSCSAYSSTHSSPGGN